MECPFQVGDPVVCIEELLLFEQKLYDFRGPIIDEVYHVRSIFLCNCGRDHVMVYLQEMFGPTMSGKEGGFPYQMFRKLLTIDDFTAKTTSAPVNSKDKVPEHA